MRTVLPFVTLLLTGLSAQEPFRANAFLPADYRNVVGVDFASLRDTGVLDELSAGVAKLALAQAEAALGVPFAALDRLTMVPRARPAAEDGAEERGPSQQSVMIIEGNREMDPPPFVVDGSYQDAEVGGREVKRREAWGDELFYQPRPSVFVSGSTAMLEPMIAGKVGPGMPAADVMSLLSSRKDRLLLYFVMDLADEKLNGDTRDGLFDGAEWPADQAPQFLFARLFAAGDADDPSIGFEVVVRHAQPGEGLDVSGKAIDGLLQKGQEMPQLRMLAPVLGSVKKSRDVSDLCYRWDLGRARTAAGTLATVLLPMLMLGRAVEAQAVAAPVQAAPVPVEPNAEKKKAPDEQKKD
ncbi:MAG: hypothetical protein KDE27_11490 [Planctomycetes bacterium]|nr:hypothetical protein [Planctomycetota bacterium]